MLLEGYLKFFTLLDFFGVLKNIKIFGFLAQAQPAQKTQNGEYLP
jgi:hypothetical protein